MPKKLLIFLFSFYSSFSYTQNVEWVNRHGSNGSDYRTSIISDSIGNSYIVGEFHGKVDFNPGTDTLYFVGEIDNYNDIFIQKLDPNGNLLWVHHIKGAYPNYDAGNNIQFDNSGNIIVYGLFDYYVDFDPGPGEFILYGQGNYSLFLLKLNPDGEFIWARHAMNKCTTCNPIDFVVDKDDNIICTGYLRGSVDVDPGPLNYPINSFNSNDEDPFVIKYNNNGDLVWAKVFSGIETGKGNAIVADSIGDIYVAGEFSKSTDFNYGPQNFYMTTLGQYIVDMFLVKLKNDGTFLWAKEIDSKVSSSIYPNDMLINKNELLIVGSFSDEIDFDLSNNSNTHRARGETDCFVLKLDVNANFKWVETFGYEGYDFAAAIDLDRNKNYFITGGLHKNNVETDPNALWVYDVFVSKMNNDGNIEWTKTYGGDETDYCTSISVSKEDIFITGSYNATADFDCFTHTSNGEQDIFIAKISNCPKDYATDTIVACEYFTWKNGVTYNSNNDTSTYNFFNTACCDSIVKLNLTINKSSSTSFKKDSVDLYIWNNITYKQSGIYTQVFKNEEGCDSIVQLQLLIKTDEDCNNSIDDDLDGYVDLFDKDCQCNDTLYNSGCVNDCKYIPDTIADLKMKLKWVTKCITPNKDIGSITGSIVVGDDILVRSSEIYKDSSINSIASINKVNGEVIKRVNFDTSILTFDSNILTFHSKNKEYKITSGYQGEIQCFENDMLKWTNSRYAKGSPLLFGYNASDFNFDGIPEIYFANKIINSENGKIIFNGKGSQGCSYISFPPGELCSISSSVAADLTSHPGLELACGNSVYELNLTNLNDTLGNLGVEIKAPSIVNEGLTSVADINGDGLLDVVVVKGNDNFDGGVWVWDPRTKAIIAFTKFNSDKGNSGGIATIADLNGDCFPEIIVAYTDNLKVYTYDGTDGLKNYFTKSTTDRSGITGSTAFDLNQDGIKEIIYRDETNLRIINGINGATIESYPMLSWTGTEYPIVADIDNDNEAEILVSGAFENADSVRIFCFESATTPWASARKIWNQSAYHITNVNDDINIPKQLQNNATFFVTDNCAQLTCNQPYNTFMCQATYRDQNGCVRWPAIDMVTDIIDYTCSGDSVTLRIEIRNQSTNAFRHDSLSLGLYSNSNDLPFFITQRPWENSQDVDTITYTISSSGINKIRARVNIPITNSAFTSNIKGLTSVLECDYENNADSIEIDLALKSLDLGPDISKCRTEVITLIAPNDFMSYLWSDHSQGNTYTTSDIGIHTLTAIDQCGRVYKDSVELKEDQSLRFMIGGDLFRCENETIELIVPERFDWVKWLPTENVTCDTCHRIFAFGDTTFNLIVITSIDNCINSDTVHFEIRQLKKRIDNKHICNGESYTFYGNEFNLSGIYEKKVNICDSLITLNLTVHSPDSIMLPTQEICSGDSLLFLGTWYKIGTNATIKLRNQYQCDSFITFELRVIDTLKTNETLSICQGDSVRIFDEWQSGPGVFSKSYQSARGCDSLSQVQLIVNSVFVNSNTQNICLGDSALIYNEWKKVAGIYSKKYQTENGCDSIETFELIVEQLIVNSDSILICEGDSVFVNGQSYRDEGNYQTILSSTEGCDTIYNFSLKYSPLLIKTENYSICEGDSVFINGNWLVPELVDGQAQVYVYEVREDNCKTEVTANFTINYSQITNNKYILCPEDSILLNSTWVNSTTELTYTLQSSEGCDSIIQAKVTKLRWPEPPVIELDCEDNVYNASINADENWDVLWSDMTNASATVLKESPAWVKVSTDENCEKIFDIKIESLPNLSQLPSFEDQNILEGNDINVKVDLPDAEWQVLWLPISAVSCDTCFETTISVASNTTITLELKHINGCTYIRTFDVIVEKEIFTIVIPNIINPTSTSGNNIWTVDFPEGYIVQEAKVYDRWGNVLYNIEGSNLISWDGKIDGCEVVPGVYVYFIRYLSPEGQMQIIKGDITVVR